MLFSPHHGDPKQARLMSDLRIMITLRDNAAASPSAVSRPSTVVAIVLYCNAYCNIVSAGLGLG